MGCTKISSKNGAEKCGDFRAKTANFRKKAGIRGKKKGPVYTKLHDVSRLHGKLYKNFQLGGEAGGAEEFSSPLLTFCGEADIINHVMQNK